MPFSAIRTLSFALLTSLLPALAPASPSEPAVASLVSEVRDFVPGQAFTVALRLKQDPGWHTYWSDPGDAGLPTTVRFTLPKGVQASPLIWPKPLVFKDPGGLTCYGYEDPALILAEIRVPGDYAGADLKLQADASWLVCKDVCIPGKGGATLTLARGAALQPSDDAPAFSALRPGLGLPPDGYQGAQGAPGAPVAVAGAGPGPQGGGATPAQGQAGPSPGLGWMLFLALAGGVLLNLMPCVLPVLSLKALSFIEQSHQGRSRGLLLAGAYAAGVLCSFWALAAVVLALKQGGAAVGWGFQFQQPGFVLFMAGVVLAFSLNLFGLFEVWLPGGAMTGLSKAGQGGGLAGSFGHGLVMTLLATPCTAPFLGTALGFAFAAPALQLLGVFTAVGVGLALPYVALAALPGARAWLPKPGPWMLRFKEAMGFLLLATVLWLLWLLGKQVGVDAEGWAGLWLLAVAVAGWLWGRIADLGQGSGRRAAAALAVLLLVGGSGAGLWPKVLNGKAAGGALEDGWQAWSAPTVDALRAQGRPIFVDFSADWCWTCKVNERGTLASAAVRDAFAKGKVALLKADWTRQDPAVTAELRSHGRSGVPLYVVYPVKGDAVVLPEVITPDLVLKALAN